MAASASSRVKPSTLPVTTTALPISVCGSVDTCTLPKSTPAFFSFVMMALFGFWLHQLIIDCAIEGPTPSMVLSCSSVAVTMLSRVPNVLANDSDAAGPKCLMPSAVSSLGSGFDFDFSSACNKLVALSSPKPSICSSCSCVRLYKSPTSATSCRSDNANTVFSPRPSMSMPPRDAKWMMR